MTQRRFFGHRGHVEELRTFLDEFYDGPSLGPTAHGELSPELAGVDIGSVDDIVTFLQMFECPPVDPSLQDPTKNN